MSKFFAFIVLAAVLINYASSASYDPVPFLEYEESPENSSEITVSVIAYGCPASEPDLVNYLANAAENKVHEWPKLLYCIFCKSAEKMKNSKCQKRVKPLFFPTATDEEDWIKCGFSDNHRLHTFGFYICGTEKNLEEFREENVRENPWENYTGDVTTLESYDVCYDTVTNETLWTRHRLANPIIFDQLELENKELPRDEISVESFFLENADFENIKKIYELETTKDASSYKILPQPLVPPAHYVFYVWKATTNHFINMAPLCENLVALISAIDAGLKAAQMRYYKSRPGSYTRLRFYTRVIDSEPSTSTSNDQKSLKPNIWHKLIHNETDGTGLMIYLHNTPGHPPKVKKCKTPIPCDFDRWTNDIKLGRNELQYAYCCSAISETVEKIFSSNARVQINGTLDLNALILGIKKRKFDTPMGGSEVVKENIRSEKRRRAQKNS